MPQELTLSCGRALNAKDVILVCQEIEIALVKKDGMWTGEFKVMVPYDRGTGCVRADLNKAILTNFDHSSLSTRSELVNFTTRI